MKIGLTGASGFIGSHIAAAGRDAGHQIVPFSRHPSSLATRKFSIDRAPDLSGLGAVIHLAGEPILGRWTATKMRRIRESRVVGTRRIVEALAGSPVGVLVNASAIGFYGSTGEQCAEENSPAGTGFLADVCRAWEAEALRAEDCGVRVVLVRVGFVIGRGGAMKWIVPAFRLGLGGPLGNGRQWMSGIHVDDVAGIFLRAAADASWRGPFNAVMPDPFRNADFTRAVARAVHRPAILPAPAAALRLVLGKVATIMLESARITSSRLAPAGYTLRHPSLAQAVSASVDR